jgi:hypothetical protein
MASPDPLQRISSLNLASRVLAPVLMLSTIPRHYFSIAQVPSASGFDRITFLHLIGRWFKPSLQENP